MAHFLEYQPLNAFLAQNNGRILPQSFLLRFNEIFSYSYSIPCDAKGKNGSLEYTNNATGDNGGTFRMENLASVACLNSLTSRQSPGNYDTVTFAGYGTWSTDDDRHLATVQISVAPDAPYVAIQIDGNLSNVNLKPPLTPAP
jgi:hypothetical protein